MSQPDAQSLPDYVTCPCQHCGGKIEFDSNQLDGAINATVSCPHCGLETILSVPRQPMPPILPDNGFRLRNAREVEREENDRQAAISASHKWKTYGAMLRDAEKGDAKAQFEVGIGFENGLEGTDYYQALKWMQLAAAQGYYGAQNKCDELRLKINSEQKEYEGKQPTKPPANFGRIGEDEEIIQQCIEVIRVTREASVSILNKNLRLGYDRAARIMFELESRGIVGSFKSADKPRDILIDLNSGGYLRGDAKWKNDLGTAYFKQKDFSDAVNCFQASAYQGNCDAQCNLGVCYFNGYGVSKDCIEAVKWCQKAAAQGNENAEYLLGVAYSSGSGVPADMQEAVKHWQRAAEKGHLGSQSHLSACFEMGNGVTQDYVQAYTWIKLAATQNYEGAEKKCQAIVLKMNAEQIAFVEPAYQILWKRERLTLRRLSDFIGQNRIKARIELAIAAAKHRGESLHHILLIGPPGSGKATLADIIAKEMNASIKAISGPAIQKVGDLVGLLTNLEEGDVLFIEEIQRLQRSIEEYLILAMRNFQLDLILDQGPNARSVRLNLPRFTVIGSTVNKERLTPNFLSCFRIIENMDRYSIGELTDVGGRFACLFEFNIDSQAADRIARSSDGTPLDVINRLQHVQDFAHVKGNGQVTLEVAEAAIKMLAPNDERPESREGRDAIPSEVRREVWRRDEGKCSKCGSRLNLEYDHIIPVSKGGGNTARNIELLCEICNRDKSASIQ